MTRGMRDSLCVMLLGLNRRFLPFPTLPKGQKKSLLIASQTRRRDYLQARGGNQRFRDSQCYPRTFLPTRRTDTPER